MAFETIRLLFKDNDEIINKRVKEYNNYKNVVNLEELTEICEIIKENNLLKEFNEISKNEYKKTESHYSVFEEKLLNEIPFFKSAREILGVKFQYLISLEYESIDYSNVKTLIYLLFINYKKYHNQESVKEIIEKCAKSNYIIKLTLQDFTNNNIPNLFDIENTLVKIKNTKFENNEIKEFNKVIMRYLLTYVNGYKCTNTFFNHIRYCPIYLMTCSAVKNNRDITYEDVIQGYLQTLKIFTEDLTPEIEKYYEEI